MLIIERVAALSKAALFAKVHDHALAEIAQIVEEVTFDAGETIMREGEYEAWMFIMVDGRAGVDVGGIEVSSIEAGASVGELSILDPAPRAATVTAITSCMLLRIDQAPFREVIEEQPEVVFSLLTLLTRMLRSANRPSSVAD